MGAPENTNLLASASQALLKLWTWAALQDSFISGELQDSLVFDQEIIREDYGGGKIISLTSHHCSRAQGKKLKDLSLQESDGKAQVPFMLPL